MSRSANASPGIRNGQSGYLTAEWEDGTVRNRVKDYPSAGSRAAVAADGFARAASSAADSLEPSEKVELAIVLAGMRRDQGDAQGAVDALTIPQLDRNRGFPYSPRLFRAYAEALAHFSLPYPDIST